MVPQVSAFVVRCRALCGNLLFLARTLMMHMVLCGWCCTSLSRLLGAAPGALGTAHSNNDLLEAILLEAGVGIGIGNEINSK